MKTILLRTWGSGREAELQLGTEGSKKPTFGTGMEASMEGTGVGTFTEGPATKAVVPWPAERRKAGQTEDQERMEGSRDIGAGCLCLQHIDGSERNCAGRGQSERRGLGADTRGTPFQGLTKESQNQTQEAGGEYFTNPTLLKHVEVYWG